MENAWASSGQLSRRFEIARVIGAGNASLFEPEDGSQAATVGFPNLSNRLYFDGIEPNLSKSTLAALDQAKSPQEWNTRSCWHRRNSIIADPARADLQGVTMHRRQFIASLGSSLPMLTVAGRVFAAPVSTPRFLLVFLRGGYDCANALVPLLERFLL